MKYIYFELKTSYSEESYFCPVIEGKDAEWAANSYLAEICFCDAYEIALARPATEEEEKTLDALLAGGYECVNALCRATFISTVPFWNPLKSRLSEPISAYNSQNILKIHILFLVFWFFNLYANDNPEINRKSEIFSVYRGTSNSIAVAAINVSGIECQSTEDKTMLIRMFEYESQIALDGGSVKGNTLTVSFPHSGVLYLRHSKKTPDEMLIRIKTSGGDVSYPVKVLKVQSYTIDEIFQKKLLFLIPFYIFTHEKRFRVYNTNEDQLNVLKNEYDVITQKLEALMNIGEINEFTKCMILDMSSRVLQHIAMNYDKVREGVTAVMGGKILNYEAKDILNREIQQGREQGRHEVAENMIRLGKNSLEEIAQCTNMSVPEVEALAEKLGVLTPHNGRISCKENRNIEKDTWEVKAHSGSSKEMVYTHSMHTIAIGMRLSSSLRYGRLQETIHWIVAARSQSAQKETNKFVSYNISVRKEGELNA